MIAFLTGMRGDALIAILLAGAAVCFVLFFLLRRLFARRGRGGKITPAEHKAREQDRWLGDGRK